VEAFGGLGLVPVTFLQHIEDDVALAVFDDVEQGGVAAMFQQGNRRAAAYDRVGKQVAPTPVRRRERPRARLRFPVRAHFPPGIREQWA